MSYKVQDIMRFIVPGLYLIGAYAIIVLLSGNIAEFLKDQETIEILKTFVPVIVLLLPFSGFVVGYLIECIMAFFERFIYMCYMPRPSWVLLYGHLKCLYMISSKSFEAIKNVNSEIFNSNRSNCKYVNNNRIAKNVYQLAKQGIDRSNVESHWVLSILARNIFGAQLLLAIFVPCYLENLSCCTIWGNIFLAFLFFFFWGHNNCVYAKYTLAEYGKVLIAQGIIQNADAHLFDGAEFGDRFTKSDGKTAIFINKVDDNFVSVIEKVDPVGCNQYLVQLNGKLSSINSDRDIVSKV